MAWQQFRKFASKVIAGNAGFLLGVSLTAIASGIALAAPMDRSFLPHLNSEISTTQTLAAATSVEKVYLYGTSPEAQQMGQDYMVVRVGENNQVQGVFYQVNSEFACFEGKIEQGSLDLSVLDPAEQTTYAYQMDYTAGGEVAENGDRLNVQFVPAGYHVINHLSELDHQLLDQCSKPKAATKTLGI